MDAPGFDTQTNFDTESNLVRFSFPCSQKLLIDKQVNLSNK